MLFPTRLPVSPAVLTAEGEAEKLGGQFPGAAKLKGLLGHGLFNVDVHVQVDVLKIVPSVLQ